LGTFGASSDGELDCITLIQAAIAIARILNFGKVHKEVLTTLVGDETITFVRVKPFDRSGRSISHFLGSFVVNLSELCKPPKKKNTWVLHFLTGPGCFPYSEVAVPYADHYTYFPDCVNSEGGENMP
jgi:hypothetical protein